MKVSLFVDNRFPLFRIILGHPTEGIFFWIEFCILGCSISLTSPLKGEA